MDSQQVRLSEILTLGDATRAVVRAQKLNVEGGTIAVGSAEGAVKIFEAGTGIAKRIIQNVGDKVVYLWLGRRTSQGGVLYVDGAYMYELKACTTSGDGTGGVIDLSWFAGDVWASTADDAGKVAFIEATGSDRLPNLTAPTTP